MIESAAIASEPFRHRVKVRWGEIDQQGVVFHPWYFVYFDDAMLAFFIERGLPLGSIGLHLVHSEIDWKGAVRQADDVQISVRPAHVGNSSFMLEFQVFRNDQPTPEVIAKTVYVYVDPKSGGKQPLPPALRAALQ